MKSEWKEVKLGSISKIRRGSSPRPIIDYMSNNGMPWVKIADATESDSRYISKTKEFIKQEGVRNSVIVNKGDLILSNSGTAGLPKFMEITACIHDGWQVFSDLNGIEKEYLYYSLIYIRTFLLHGANDSTMKNLTLDMVRDAKINLPPLSTQKKIAHILSTLDDKIELNRKMNQTLEEMAQTLFKSWFVDFDPVHAKAKCSSDEELETAACELGISKDILELFPSEFEESELGMIPKGWEVKKLGECELEIESGTRPKGGIDKELNSGMPSVGAESIAPIGVFDFSNVKYVTNEFAIKAKRGWVQNMDVALYKDGGKPGVFMPRVSLYGNEYPFKKFMINEHVFLLRSRKLGQYYLFQLISSKSILDQLIAKGSAKAAQPGLNQVEVNDSKFVLPTKELLISFNEYIGLFVDKQLENGKQIQTLQKTRDTLLPKLLSGELDVSELELDLD
jgi:type I restriction enzyme, S subunit